MCSVVLESVNGDVCSGSMVSESVTEGLLESEYGGMCS